MNSAGSHRRSPGAASDICVGRRLFCRTALAAGLGLLAACAADTLKDGRSTGVSSDIDAVDLNADAAAEWGTPGGEREWVGGDFSDGPGRDAPHDADWAQADADSAYDGASESPADTGEIPAGDGEWSADDNDAAQEAEAALDAPADAVVDVEEYVPDPTDADPIVEEEIEEVPLYACDPGAEPLRLYLSADDSNSMASPAIARAVLNGGSLPSPDLIRTYEFTNYYSFDFPAPAAFDLALFAEMGRASERDTARFDLALAAQAHRMVLRGTTRKAAELPSRPLVLTFVVDLSGSMSGPPLNRLKAVLNAIGRNLRRGDRVSFVTWNTQQLVRLEGHTVTGPNDSTYVRMVAGFNADGGTDLDSGLRRGYEIANRNFRSGALNRVVLISDGQANAGQTAADIVAQQSERADGDNLYLVGVGCGDGFNDTLMNAITDRGRGAYVYIDGELEAERMFGDPQRLFSILEVAARGVRMELTLPSRFALERFFGEEVSTNPRAIEPQHLGPNDAQVFYQIVGDCRAGDPFGPDDVLGLRATFADAYTGEPKAVERRIPVAELLDSPRPHLAKLRAVTAYAEGLKALSYPRYCETTAPVEALIAAAGTADPEVREIADLWAKALRIRGCR